MTELFIIIAAVLLAPLVFSRMGFLVGVTAAAGAASIGRSIFNSTLFRIAIGVGIAFIIKAVMS